MIIQDKKNGLFTLIPQPPETTKDIAVAVILASYDSAIPYGYGFSRPNQTELTKEMAERMLNGEDISHDYPSNPNEPNEVNMDYVFGRCCKTLVKIKDGVVETRFSLRDRQPKVIMKMVQKILKNEEI